MSTLVAAAYNGTPGLGSAIKVEIRDATTGGVIVANSHTGVREDKAGCYVWAGTITDAPGYEAIWDDGTGSFYVGVVTPIIQTIIQPVAPVAQILGPSPAPGTLWRKRNDTREPVLYQAVEWNEVTQVYQPVNITGATAIKFFARLQPDTGSIFISGTGAIASFTGAAAAGWMTYQWAVGDLDTIGTYDWEFEVTFSDGRKQTFPVTTDPAAEYGILHVIADLDNA